MFPYTSDFQKTAKNPLIFSRKRKVQKISPRHQSKRLVPCGVCNIDVKDKRVNLLKSLYIKDFSTYRYELH